jgi:hypothetical protein
MIEQVRQRVFLTVESYYLCPAEPRLPLALVASNLNHGTGLVRKPVIGFLSRSPTITTGWTVYHDLACRMGWYTFPVTCVPM